MNVMAAKWLLGRGPAVLAARSIMIFILLSSTLSAGAVTNEADISVGMKTLPLLTNKIIDTATLAIVFDPANAASKKEADDIKSILDGGFEVPGNLKLTNILVPATDLSKLAGSKIAILTDGLGAHFDAISTAAAGNNILTMSTDLNCVQAGKCVLGIISKPHVEIYYSKAAAEAARISFGQVFTLLVNQI